MNQFSLAKEASVEEDDVKLGTANIFGAIVLGAVVVGASIGISRDNETYQAQLKNPSMVHKTLEQRVTELHNHRAQWTAQFKK